MGSEGVDGLPDELESWVAERAAASDSSRAAVLRRLLAAHRLLDEQPDALDGSDSIALADRLADGESAGDGSADSADVDSFAGDLDELTDDLEEVAARVGALEADLDEKITDVRERVIQVKRESDAKAPQDHGHPELERRMQQGFANYEEILEYLTDRSEEHGSKLDTIAGVLVDLRERVTALERESNERAAATELRREANRHGIAEAVCESCGGTVRLGLLDGPFCPHCESTFAGVEPKHGFFGSHRLTVGQRPALEPPTDAGPAAAAERDGEALFDDAAESAEQPPRTGADGGREESPPQQTADAGPEHTDVGSGRTDADSERTDAAPGRRREQSDPGDEQHPETRVIDE